MVVVLVPLMWLIDTVLNVWTDDPNVAKYLALAKILMPAMIALGLLLDALAFFFPTLTLLNRKADISPADRVGEKPDMKSKD